MKLFLTLVSVILFFGCSTNTDSSENTNTNIVPLVPSNLTSTNVSTTQINLSWTDNSTNETGFKIEHKIGTSTFVLVGTTETDISNFNSKLN